MSYVPLLFVTILLLVVAIGIIMLVLVYQKKQLQYLNEKHQLQASFEKRNTRKQAGDTGTNHEKYIAGSARQHWPGTKPCKVEYKHHLLQRNQTGAAGKGKVPIGTGGKSHTGPPRFIQKPA